MSMKAKLRKSLFWLHLGIGVISGLIIGLMALTGAIMAFENEITTAIDSPVSTLTMPAASSQRMSVDDLLSAAKKAQPDVRFTNLEAFAADDQAWILHAGRESSYYLDPYTAQLTAPRSTAWKEFFHTVEMLHRWLLTSDENRSFGKAITGAACLSFFGLCITGLYLWFPIHIHRRALKSGLVIHWKAKGKARDYNWHRVFGFWALPILLIIIVTGCFFSYEWMKKATISTLGPAPARGIEIPSAFQNDFKPNPAALPMETIYQKACGWSPTWTSINLPLPKAKQQKQNHAERRPRPKGKGHHEPSNSIAITESDVNFPRRPSQILIHPMSGELIAEANIRHLSFGQKILSSMKGIHTGEAGYLPGKIIAFLASVSALILVYTGFALSFRRLKRKLA